MAKVNVYDHHKLENKWQSKWAKEKIYKAEEKGSKKYYFLVELAYTSGDLHMGHWFAWTAPDAYARFMRMSGKNVLFPVGGFDAFGLPAENAAIKKGIHPKDWTYKNIKAMRSQFATMGPSFDWDKEVITSDPEYYRWTQWLFLKLYKEGLAYKDKIWSNWCPECKTVLANEHVIDGCCWRHSQTPVVQKQVSQWLFAITKYADKLIWPQNPEVDWPKEAREAQNNWIGKSEGVEIKFKVEGNNSELTVFTTRPDTIFGATFLVLAPQHPLALKLAKAKYKEEVRNYIEESRKKLELQRLEEARQKTGVFTGSYALNPLSREKIPLFVADFVLTTYGTGAIMGVPAHDARDLEFAKKYSLPTKPVVLPQREYIDNNAKSYYEKRTKIIRDVLTKIARLASENAKKLLVFGGWGVSIQVGQEFREFEDLDICVLEEDLSWWKDQFNSLGLKISNMFPDPKNNDKYYFQATKQDVHIDVLTIKVEKDQKVIFLSQKEPEESNYSFSAMFEKKEFDRIPVWVLKKDRIYHWKKDHQAEHGLYRWKEQSDFAMMGFEAYEGDGLLIHSGDFTGLNSNEAKTKISKYIEDNQLGRRSTQYHLRDWTISRQRYWGAPIPIIYCGSCGTVPVPEKDLPVTLPDKVDYTPTGKPPLATAEGWVRVKCPNCGREAKRDTETMDTYVDSSWYFLRYPSPHYNDGPFDPKTVREWFPLEVYFGGPEHVLGHTLYARFITKVLYELGYLPYGEFAKIRRHHGVILGTDGVRMSKSRGNVVNPDEEVKKFGADAVRLYLAFLGPHDKGGAWNREGIEGSRRFLNRVWVLVNDYKNLVLESEKDAREILSFQHKTVQRVTQDFEKMQFNTAIARIMEFVNLLYDKVGAKTTKTKGEMRCAEWDEALKSLALLLAPFAPHITEEIWVEVLGQKFSIHKAEWPSWRQEFVKSEEVTIPVQVDGRLRGQITVRSQDSALQVTVRKLAEADNNVSKWISGKKVKRVVFVPGRLINFVVGDK